MVHIDMVADNGETEYLHWIQRNWMNEPYTSYFNIFSTEGLKGKEVHEIITNALEKLSHDGYNHEEETRVNSDGYPMIDGRGSVEADLTDPHYVFDRMVAFGKVLRVLSGDARIHHDCTWKLI